MPERHNNTIYKLFLRNKKIIKVILSSITRIGLIIYIKDPEEAPGVNHAHIECHGIDSAVANKLDC